MFFNHLFCALFSAGDVTKYEEINHMAYGLEELPASWCEGKGVAEDIRCLHNGYELRPGVPDSKDMQIIIVRCIKKGRKYVCGGSIQVRFHGGVKWVETV